MEEQTPATPAEGQPSAPVTTDNTADASGEDGAAAPTEETRESRRNAEIARKFAALSRETKAYKQRAAEIDQREAQLAQREQQVQQILAAQRRAAEDPEGWLKQGNLTYDKVTESLLKNKQSPQDRQYEERLKRMAELEQQTLAQQQQMQTVQQQFVKMQFLDRIRQTVQSDMEQYELIHHFDALEDVFDYMDQYATKHGEILDVAKACQVIEGLLEDEEEKRTRRALASKKLASRVGWHPQKESQPGDALEALSQAPPQKTPARGRYQKPTPARKPTPPAEPKAVTPLDLDKAWEKLKSRATKRR